MTDKSLKQKLKRYKGAKENFEYLQFSGPSAEKDAEEMRQYFQYIKLSPDTREKCRKVWDEYYLAVRNTPVAQIVAEQRRLLLLGVNGKVEPENVLRIKELANEVQEMKKNGDIPSIPVPDVIDPYLMENGYIIGLYKNILREIKSLESMLESGDMFQDIPFPEN